MDEWEDILVKRSEPTAIVIKVTADHIRRGNRRNYTFDPISIAVRDQLSVDWAAFGWGYGKTIKNDIHTSYYIASDDSKRLIAWIKNWDRGQPVFPIEFKMYKEKSVDKTPKQSKRKPSKYKNFSDLQVELDLK